jgi:hypothetical protein
MPVLFNDDISINERELQAFVRSEFATTPGILTPVTKTAA